MSLVGNFVSPGERSSVDHGSPLQRIMSTHNTTKTINPNAGSYPDDDVEEVFTPIEERHEQITQLARQITRQSTRNEGLHRVQSNGTALEAGDLFDYEEGSDLDPFSENFDVRRWTKLALRNRETAPRTAGISYNNLNVFGYGSEAGEVPLVTSNSRY